MPKDTDDLYKKLMDLSKENERLSRDLEKTQRLIKSLTSKIDQILDIVSSLTIVTEDDSEYLYDNDYDEGNEGFIADVQWYSEENNEEENSDN